MKYFDGIHFIGWGVDPHYASPVCKTFGNYYGIQYNHSGKVYCAMDHGSRVDANGAHAFITRPGHYYEYGAGGKERYHLYVCFNGPRIQSYEAGGLLDVSEDNPLVPIIDFERFFMDIRELQRCLNENPSRYDRAVNLLEGLLLQMREAGIRRRHENDLRLSAFRALGERIGSSPLADWDFAHEAGRMNLSLPHFRRLFVQYLGCAPGHYIMRCRLKLAAGRLCASEDKISAIAEETGFYDLHHFARMFRRYYQLPPATYRHEFNRR